MAYVIRCPGNFITGRCDFNIFWITQIMKIGLIAMSGVRAYNKELMKHLGAMEIMSVIIEGGAEVNSSAIKEGIVDKLFHINHYFPTSLITSF